MKRAFVFTKGGKEGFVDNKGSVIAPPTYDLVGQFHQGYAPFRMDGKYGVVSSSGTVVVPNSYDEILLDGDIEIGFPVLKGDDWGFLGLDGQEVLPFVFLEVLPFEDGVAAVRVSDSEWRYIDKGGNVLFCLQADAADDLVGFSCGLKRVEIEKGSEEIDEDDGLYGFCGKDGQMRIPPSFSFAADKFNEERAFVRALRNGKYGVIDTMGEYIVPPDYLRIGRCSGGYLVARSDAEKWEVLHSDGNLAWQRRAYDLSSPMHGFIRWKEDRQFCGVLKSNGDISIPNGKFVSAFWSESMIASVRNIKNKHGCIDLVTGNTVLDCLFDDEVRFSGDLALIREGKSRRYIDKSGATVFRWSD